MTPLAQSILDDIRGARAFEPREDAIASLEAAYRVQDEVNAALLAEQPARSIVGYKIAFNRQSSLDYYGLDEPCFAPLFSDQVHASGVVLPLAAYRDLVVEPEIAIRLGSSLQGQVSERDAEEAIEAWLPAIEIMDVRHAFARDPSAAAAVAQRIHNEGAVLGTATLWISASDTTAARMLHSDHLLGEAVNAAPQPPLKALCWLANRLRRDAKYLQAGMVILTGAYLPGQAITTPGLVKAEIRPFGRVEFTLI
ncbi:2-keto-4-pentenoate hydratase [Tianweitania sediminis]|uniref:Hydratase/decarboxylase n=1 Tax=Tianweitania sediminis TaxID=1502156 RepID=A0A8J7RK05_9HYPH|nr:hypothetical protein [Tianweitania sediminis]MBP0437124.1 hypothetical protein [Tianweitania sediminis]